MTTQPEPTPPEDAAVLPEQTEMKMQIIEKRGEVAIWRITEAHGDDYYVYAGQKLVRVCPSIGMAREVAAGV